MSIESPAEGNGVYELRGVESMEDLTEARAKLEGIGFSVPDAGHDLGAKQWQVEVHPDLKSEQRKKLAPKLGFLLVPPRLAA